MEFNKIGFENFRVDFEKAIKELEAKYQVEIKTGKIKYTDIDFTIETKVKRTDLDTSVEQIEFERYCILYGFLKDDYKRKFVSQGIEYMLVGFNLKSPKNSCTIQRVSDNVKFKCSEKMVKFQ